MINLLNLKLLNSQYTIDLKDYEVNFMYDDEISSAKEKFELLIRNQLLRVENIKKQNVTVDYSKLERVVIGICSGDGIGPIISKQAEIILRFLLKDEIKENRIVIKNIAGLTIENRLFHGCAIPKNVLQDIKQCHVILKAPTTTPREGDIGGNIESANVAMRKELDLFANIRPIRIPHEDIDWTFFRENTEGGYAAGSEGIKIASELGIDFTITSAKGTERIIAEAFEYAIKNGKKKVTAVTKANIIKTTDGMFLDVFYQIAKKYPNIIADDWYIDIMTAKLIDEKRRKDFQVIVLPNLYGDILTDEAAEIQGGVGTAGSANVGKRYAMFEAVHGSAPRMIDEGREMYADPSSIIRASAMMIRHIGYFEKASILDHALDKLSQSKKYKVNEKSGFTNKQFTQLIINTIQNLEEDK